MLRLFLFFLIPAVGLACFMAWGFAWSSTQAARDSANLFAAALVLAFTGYLATLCSFHAFIVWVRAKKIVLDGSELQVDHFLKWKSLIPLKGLKKKRFKTLDTNFRRSECGFYFSGIHCFSIDIKEISAETDEMLRV